MRIFQVIIFFLGKKITKICSCIYMYEHTLYMHTERIKNPIIDTHTHSSLQPQQQASINNKIFRQQTVVTCQPGVNKPHTDSHK